MIRKSYPFCTNLLFLVFHVTCSVPITHVCQASSARSAGLAIEDRSLRKLHSPRLIIHNSKEAVLHVLGKSSQMFYSSSFTRRKLQLSAYEWANFLYI